MWDRLRRNLYADLVLSKGYQNGISMSNRLLIGLIIVSIILVVLESEPSIEHAFPDHLRIIGLLIGAVFLIEYIFRIWVCVEDPRYSHAVWGRLKYSVTPMALIDLLAVIPFFILATGNQAVLLRFLRLISILRIAKLGRYSQAISAIGESLYARRFELLTTLAGGLILLLISATFLHIAEGDSQPEGFGSIPRAMWWSVATLTTVGYGDTFPITLMGKIFASLTAILGIGLVAMPAGILAASFSEVLSAQRKSSRDGQDHIE